MVLFSKTIVKFSRNHTNSAVIVTMTTLPSRIHHIAPTLASLLRQTTPPQKIILNLPFESSREQRRYQIPRFLTTHPLIQINRVDRDFGPATKLLPALRLSAKKNVRLLVVDDDEVYGRKIIENYMKYEPLAKTSALTLVGWDAPADGQHHSRRIKFGAIGEKPKDSVEVSTPTQVDCFQGASTFMVSPSFFSDEVFNDEKAPKEAFFVDDIYLSGHLATRKVPIFVVPADFRYARMKVLTHLLSGRSLHKKENKSGHNNHVLYAHYSKHWPSRRVLEQRDSD